MECWRRWVREGRRAHYYRALLHYYTTTLLTGSVVLLQCPREISEVARRFGPDEALREGQRRQVQQRVDRVGPPRAERLRWEVPVFDWRMPVFDWKAPVFDW